MQNDSPSSAVLFSLPPLQLFSFPGSGFQAQMLRLDLLRSWASGNKYFKLKYTLDLAIKHGYTKIISKGGMFSNHLAALAEACVFFNLKFVAVVRSHAPDEHNPSIIYLRKMGAEIHFKSPAAYNAFDRTHSIGLDPEAFFIPEGGLSQEGIWGCQEITAFLGDEVPTHIVVAGGTMATAVGLMTSAPATSKVIIVPAWKGCTNEYVEQCLSQFQLLSTGPWELWSDHQHLGFGRYDNALMASMTNFSSYTGIPLDPVYTGKMVHVLEQKITEGYFNPDDRVVVIHTGGLQGLKGFKHRYPEAWTDYVRRYEDLSM